MLAEGQCHRNDKGACKCMCSEGHNLGVNCHEARLSDEVGISESHLSHMLESPEKELCQY